ncbi:MAG: sigma-70 family RNA polymerase sigma factor [Marinobacter sp.]|uniref:sigma-70 family RNA polymerase sigma factor n=1 Tax=Marinobacter sp. TaxID=50741 RepID=UPI0034A04D18
MTEVPSPSVAQRLPDPGSPASAAHIADLLHKVAEKDRAAFAELYKSTAPKLFGTVLRILNQKSWAEDVVQDAYVKIWQKAVQFDAAKASPITWMVTIARNSAIDALRKQPTGQKASQEELDQVAAVEPNAIFQLENEQSLRQLHHCLDELDEARREMVQLAYLKGWSRANLSTYFDQPVNTIKTGLHRALKQLKRCLAP